MTKRTGPWEGERRGGNLALFLLPIFLCAKIYIRHLHVSRNNTPCLPAKILHKLCFHFSWVLQPSQEKLKTMLVHNVGAGGGGGGGANKVHFGRCTSGELRERRLGTSRLLSPPSAVLASLFCGRAKASNLVFNFYALA